MQTLKSEPRGPMEHARRDQIVAAANDHFRLYGYDKTTVGDLAKAIGFSTAYVYKFFESKQAIGDAICGNCLAEIADDLHGAVDEDTSSSQHLSQIFRILARHAQDLLVRESKLQEMILAAHAERWHCFEKHKSTLRAAILRVVEEGRRTGEFERKTPIDETCLSIMLVMEPFWNPALWADKLDQLDEQAVALAALVLRSIVP